MDATYIRYFKTVALIWFGCFAVLFLAYLLVLLPQEEKLVGIAGVRKGKEIEYKVIQQNTGDKELNQLKAEVKNLQDQLAAYIIEYSNVGREIFEVNQLVSQMNVSSFANKGRATETYRTLPNCYNLGEIPFKVDFNADFNRFAQVVNALKRHAPVVFVDQFSVTRSKSDNINNIVKMNLNLLVKIPPKDQGPLLPGTFEQEDMSNLRPAEATESLR